MDDANGSDMSDNDEFMLDIELTADDVEDVMHMALGIEENRQAPIPMAIDLPTPTDESISFDGNQFGHELLKYAGHDDFQKVLYEHWKLFVPQCFVFPTQLIKGIVQQRVEDILLRPLDIFLYGTSEIDEAKTKIRSFNKRPTVCGHLFKSDEPTYFCRDCCVDATCVLCTDCFLQSEHRKHRYKVKKKTNIDRIFSPCSQ